MIQSRETVASGAGAKPPVALVDVDGDQHPETLPTAVRCPVVLVSGRPDKRDRNQRCPFDDLASTVVVFGRDAASDTARLLVARQIGRGQKTFWYQAGWAGWRRENLPMSP